METRDLMMAPVPVKLRPDQYCGKIIDHTRVSRRVGRDANRLPKEALITYLKPRHDSINEDGNTQTRVRRRKNVYQKQSGSCSTSKNSTGEPDQGIVVKNSSTVIVDGIPFVDLLPDYTKALIKEKYADQDQEYQEYQEIATTSCKVSLACPLGKMRMNAPCRVSTCDHLQCFDAQLYLQMNEKKPKWVCPVCNKPALMENLLVDGFFMELIRSPRLPADEHEIVLHNDGTWDPLPPKKDEYTPIASKSTTKKPLITDTLSVDDSDNDTSPTPTPGPSSQKTVKRFSSDSIDCITLDSDDSDHEIVPPPKKRPRSDTNSQKNPPGSPDLICLDDD